MPLQRSTAIAAPSAPPDTVESLLAQLHHGATAAERRAAAQDLAAHPNAAAQLGAALAGQVDAPVCRAILASLVAHATPAAAMAILAHLPEAQASLRAMIVTALQEMGAMVAPLVAPMLQQPDPSLRIHAVSILEGIVGPQAQHLLREALATEADVNVGLAVVEAMTHRADEDDADALRAFAARFPAEPFVAFAVGVALQNMARA